MARRRFFVDEVRSGHARIQGDEAHHLTRVLRVERGQRYELSDNECVYLAEVESAHKNLVDFAIVERLPVPVAALPIRLYAALVRFERFELLIEKATELGVSAIIPVIAERSEKGIEQAVGKRLTRWNRIAREASEQSRRLRLPQLAEPVRLQAALADPAPYRYFLDEGQAPAFLTVLPIQLNSQDSVALLAGPEGGWTDRERLSASGLQSTVLSTTDTPSTRDILLSRDREGAVSAFPWTPVSLGPQILKSETAILAALAILNAWCASHAILTA